MGLQKNMTTVLLVLFIVGCASQVERARGVQNTVDDHADATRKAVDNQERGDTP
jgi:hypothetical protein